MTRTGFDRDAVIVGAGPNGLAAAIVLARAGLSVLVLEAKPTVGGGCRTEELTLPGFRHDVCAAVHPMGLGSPFFRELPLGDHGLEWVHPEVPLVHPLDDGRAVALHRDLEQTCANLGTDGDSYRRLVEPFSTRAEHLIEDMLAPVGRPRHPWLMAKFGLVALRSAEDLARSRFRGVEARALFAGMAAHAIQPLDNSLTSAFGVVLCVWGHAFGWPVARGGSQAIVDALAAHLATLGGAIETDRPVNGVDELPSSRLVLFDVTPLQLVALGGNRLPPAYRRKLMKFRHGAGVFKLDYALSEPVPWRAEIGGRAGTVHLGGTLGEIAASEKSVSEGRHPDRPYVLVVQASLCDGSRAPDGRHTAWAYCHVPYASTYDMTERVESQIERFAPGFRDTVLARSVMPPARMEDHNPNYRGGDITGGAQDLLQTFRRPASFRRPYEIPVPGWFLCSSSTPPGGGVHGMCGYHAATAALRSLR